MYRFCLFSKSSHICYGSAQKRTSRRQKTRASSIRRMRAGAQEMNQQVVENESNLGAFSVIIWRFFCHFCEKSEKIYKKILKNLRISEKSTNFAHSLENRLLPTHNIVMILFTEKLFLTDEQEGFRICRETRTSATATMTVLYCEAGFIDVYFQGKMLRINPGELFVRVPDFQNPLGPYKMSDDFKFKQISIAAEIYEEVMYNHMRIEPNWYIKQEYVREHPIFPLNEVSKDFFFTYFHLLELQLQDRLTNYRIQILKAISHGATLEMLNYLDKLAVIPTGESNRTSVNQSDYIFRAFTRLLQQHPHEREVQWYAQQLDITPKYLSEICKERSTKSAGEWIAEVTVSELKHYLQDTAMPIHDIAIAMDFPNASFFCQYTKKHTGMTPNQFRKQKDR